MIEERTSISVSDINKITVRYYPQENDCRFAFYIYKNDKIIEKIGYSEEPVNYYWATEGGEYKAKIFVIDDKEEKRSFFTDSVEFEGLLPIIQTGTTKKKPLQFLRNTWRVVKEMYVNRKRIARLSLFDYELINKDSYLGWFWSILSPLIQIGTYWFVFGVGIRNNKPVDGVPFLPWMLCGLIPWFFWSHSITRGAGSIYGKAAIVLKLNYPVSTVPLETLLAGVYEFLMQFVILVIMLLFFGYYPNLYWLNLIYYFLFQCSLLLNISLITSALTMVARDFQKLLTSLIRLWFYLTPILWNMNRLPTWVQNILKLNPALYVVVGYRDSILYKIPFYAHEKRLLFFWAVNIILLIVGANIQIKYRDNYADMM